MGELAQSITDERLELARALVASLEAGRESDAAETFASLHAIHEDARQQMSHSGDQPHDRIRRFLEDSHLADIAASDMKDAAERLTHVIRMTDDAASTTLAAVEGVMPMAGVLHEHSAQLADCWERFRARELDVHDFRQLSTRLDAFLRDTQANAGQLHDQLSKVLLAQEYQDLTGQILQRVIELVREVEGKLEHLMNLAGARPSRNDKQSPELLDTHAQGPIVPGVDRVDSVAGQDEVDDLLSSLGI